jgi:very-short-patch-repair endonuclease
MTIPERLLWRALRQRPQGIKFRRQHPIGPYIADFCCLQARLVIEVDGFVHDTAGRAERDARREKYIEENGFRVVRISAARVIADAVDTAARIVALAEGPLHQPSAGPPPRAGEVN